MKTLYLLRHAKSSWKDPELSDFERPLNQKGKEKAPLMGRHLKKLKVFPELIISSPAKRAFDTAEIIAKEVGYPNDKIQLETGLYGATTDELMAIIQSLEPSLHKVMLVGHNPVFTEIIDYLSGVDIENLPSAGFVQIGFDLEKWQEIRAGKGKLQLFEYPKKLKEKK